MVEAFDIEISTSSERIVSARDAKAYWDEPNDFIADRRINNGSVLVELLQMPELLLRLPTQRSVRGHEQLNSVEAHSTHVYELLIRNSAWHDAAREYAKHPIR